MKKSKRSGTSFQIGISPVVRKWLAVMVGAALVLALVITQYFHGRMMDMRQRAEQLRARNAVVSNENIQLLASRAQLASKTQIAATAGTKMNLYEPGKGQVRRM